MLYLKIAEWVAYSVDPDGTPRFVASHVRLHCCFGPVWLNTPSKVYHMIRDMLRQTGKLMTKSSVITN